MACEKITSEDQESAYRKVFNFFGPVNGVITASGMGNALRALGNNPTDAEIRNVIADIHQNGDTLTYEQFKEVVNKYKEKNPEEELREAFRKFDEDGNGFISVKELQKRMTTLGEPVSWEEAEQIVNKADVNKDGQLDYNEFIKMIQGPD